MAVTTLAQLIEPRVFQDYLSRNTMERTAFWQSGAIVTSPILEDKANSGGRILDIPHWADLANSEPNYSSDNPSENSTPDNIGSFLIQARVGYLNKSWSAADLASEIAGANAMARIADRVDAYWGRQYQARLIAIATGVLNNNVADNNSDMVFNAARTTTGAATSANLFNRTNFVKSAFTLGDAFENTGALAVHSVVYAQMVQDDAIDFIVDSAGSMRIPTYLGHRVILDDGMPAAMNATSGLIEYTSILFGAGFFGYGEGSPENPVEVDRKPEAGNGAGVETLFTRKTNIIHPAGHSFTSSSVAGLTPTLAELRLAANWNRAFPERKQCQIAFLITNG